MNPKLRNVNWIKSFALNLFVVAVGIHYRTFEDTIRRVKMGAKFS